MFSLVWQLPVGKRAPAYGRYGTFCSLHRCLPLSPRLPPPAPSFPSFYLPHLRLKKKSKSAHRQGTISLGHLQSPVHISISPHFCSLSSLFSKHRINPKPLWEKPRHSNSKGTSESILHFISRLASVKPSVLPPARPLSRSLIYHFHQFFFWYRLTRVFLLLACFIVDSFFTLTETSLHSVTFWLAVSLFWLCFFFFFFFS